MDSIRTATSRNSTRISGASTPNELFRRIEGVPGRQSAKGYTLVEVMVFIVLVTLLMGAAVDAICSGNRISHRLSDYTAAMAVVEAKVQDIRAATYNPPTSPFTASTVVLTNASSIALDQAGATFVISGTVTSTIVPFALGHLVTVTGTFQTRGSPIIVSLQTVVNKYSAGQQ